MFKHLHRGQSDNLIFCEGREASAITFTSFATCPISSFSINSCLLSSLGKSFSHCCIYKARSYNTVRPLSSASGLEATVTWISVVWQCQGCTPVQEETVTEQSINFFFTMTPKTHQKEKAWQVSITKEDGQDSCISPAPCLLVTHTHTHSAGFTCNTLDTLIEYAIPDMFTQTKLDLIVETLWVLSLPEDCLPTPSSYPNILQSPPCPSEPWGRFNFRD